MQHRGRIIERRARGLIRVLEVWFDDMPESTRGFDLLVCHQRSRWIHPDRWLYYYTMLFDLTLSEDQLLERTSRTTGREIRKARDTDGLSCTFTLAPTDEEIDAFVAYFNANAFGPGRHAMNRSGLARLRDAGLLSLSSVTSREGEVLVRRANLCHGPQKRARGLYGVSLNTADPKTRKLAGRANRLLHFREMLFFKAQGFLVYDFGGWYTGKEDAKRLQINKFKEGFGGQLAVGYDCEEPASLRGWAYYGLRALYRRFFRPDFARERARRRQAYAPEPE